jgi:hypothetical protein
MAGSVSLQTLRITRWLGSRIIFVSYRRNESSDISGRIYDRLASAYGRKRVIRDVDSIPLGVDYREYIERAIPLCSVFLPIIGPNWLNTMTPRGLRALEDPEDMVRKELIAAFENGIRIIPLLVGGATMPLKDALPAELRKLVYRHAISVRSDPDFHWDIDRLVGQL